MNPVSSTTRTPSGAPRCSSTYPATSAPRVLVIVGMLRWLPPLGSGIPVLITLCKPIPQSQIA